MAVGGSWRVLLFGPLMLVTMASAGPISPAESLDQIEVIEGFDVDLFAHEPQVLDPVDMAFDENGRVYVVEMRGFQLGAEGKGARGLGRVRLLEDTDWDGRADSDTIFLDKMTYPTAIMPWKGGVLIGVAPDLIFAKDTDGDNVADVTEVLYTGFGTGNHEQLINSLQWGLDNWIYACSGGNGGDITSPMDSAMKPVSVSGRDIRFRPDLKNVEPLSGGGQYGMTMDDWGSRFTCNNSSHLRHYVIEDPYLRRNPYLAVSGTLVTVPDHGAAAKVHRISPFEEWRAVRTARRAADPALRKSMAPTELVAGGFFTGACSVKHYKGDSFPDAFYGNVFVGDVSNSIIHRDRLERSGTTFVGRICDVESEFLASKDNWFRPANLHFGPDGALYVVDFYRNIIETPASIPADILAKIDMNAGNDMGRIYRVHRKSQTRRRKPNLGQASTEQLVKTLEDADGWWRNTAHRLLIERSDKAAIGHLAALAKSTKRSVAKVHALWAMEGLAGLDDALIEAGLQDEDPRVREQAVRLAERRIAASDRWIALLDPLTADPDTKVRFQLALTLGESSSDQIVPLLAKIAVKDGADLWMQYALLSSVERVAPNLLNDLMTGDVTSKVPTALLNGLATVVGASAKPDPVDALVKTLAAAIKKDRTSGVASCLTGLAEGLRLGGGRGMQLPSSQNDLLTLLDAGPPNIQRPALDVARMINLTSGDRLKTVVDNAAELATDSDAALDARTVAVELLSLGNLLELENTFLDLLNFQQPKQIQLAAVNALGFFDAPDSGRIILSEMSGYGPEMRNAAMETMFARSNRLPLLLSAIEDGGVPAWAVGAERREQLEKHSNSEIRQRAVKVFAETVREDRQKIYESYLPALQLNGDPERGKKVFLDNCSQCHQVMGLGTAVGADLKGVKDRQPEAIMIEVLMPSRAITAGFENYVIETVEGELVTGVVAAETATSVTLRRAKGEETVLLRASIDTMYATKLSIMPEELEKSINHQQMADLIQFIKSQK
jgi:putative membrane-bound dehydrogenase-like protein